METRDTIPAITTHTTEEKGKKVNDKENIESDDSDSIESTSSSSGSSSPKYTPSHLNTPHENTIVDQKVRKEVQQTLVELEAMGVIIPNEELDGIIKTQRDMAATQKLIRNSLLLSEHQTALEMRKLEEEKINETSFPATAFTQFDIKKKKFGNDLAYKNKKLIKEIKTYSHCLTKYITQLLGSEEYLRKATDIEQVYDIERVASHASNKLARKQACINRYKRQLNTFFINTDQSLKRRSGAKTKDKRDRINKLHREFTKISDKELDKTTIKEYIIKARKIAKEHTTTNPIKLALLFIFRWKTKSEKRLDKVFDSNNKLRKK
jgi:hypothetical protein